MNKEEALRYLKQNGYCIVHEAQFDPSKGCPECAAEAAMEKQKRFKEALQALQPQPHLQNLVPTIGVTVKASNSFAVINEVDFDPQLHEKVAKT